VVGASARCLPRGGAGAHQALHQAGRLARRGDDGQAVAFARQSLALSSTWKTVRAWPRPGADGWVTHLQGHRGEAGPVGGRSLVSARASGMSGPLPDCSHLGDLRLRQGARAEPPAVRESLRLCERMDDLWSTFGLWVGWATCGLGATIKARGSPAGEPFSLQGLNSKSNPPLEALALAARPRALAPGCTPVGSGERCA
jgi:hypothetical protein